ncbi:hypothetical protein WHK35_14435, partial [Staphylococcus aureus]|uniref:hypothetical protein n=1 Tax=Staphylococcus aureus TaxID=1280 RepID=UPI0039BDD605
MQDERALLTDRARSLLLSFAVSLNANDFCRFLTVVAFRDLGATEALMARVDPDGVLRIAGQYGQAPADAEFGLEPESQTTLIKQSITLGRVKQASVDLSLSPETELDFMAI